MMQQRSKGVIFFWIFFVIIIIFATFALDNKDSEYETAQKEYKENLRVLNDTIRTLRKDIEEYRKELERIDLERKCIKKELNDILRNNEKIDSCLANGDWSTNVEFLSKFLSEEDSLE